MDSKSQSQRKVQMFGLVRDKNGKPKFDDIYNIPQTIWDMLTPEEKQKIKNYLISLTDNLG